MARDACVRCEVCGFLWLLCFSSLEGSYGNTPAPIEAKATNGPNIVWREGLGLSPAVVSDASRLQRHSRIKSLERPSLSPRHWAKKVQEALINLYNNVCSVHVDRQGVAQINADTGAKDNAATAPVSESLNSSCEQKRELGADLPISAVLTNPITLACCLMLGVLILLISVGQEFLTAPCCVILYAPFCFLAVSFALLAPFLIIFLAFPIAAKMECSHIERAILICAQFRPGGTFVAFSFYTLPIYALKTLLDARWVWVSKNIQHSRRDTVKNELLPISSFTLWVWRQLFDLFTQYAALVAMTGIIDTVLWIGLLASLISCFLITLSSIRCDPFSRKFCLFHLTLQLFPMIAFHLTIVLQPGECSEYVIYNLLSAAFSVLRIVRDACKMSEYELLRQEDDEERKQVLSTFLQSAGFSSMHERKKHGGSYFNPDFTYPLHEAVHKNDSGAIAALLWAGASKDCVDSRGHTPLALARKLNKRGSHREVIGALCE